MRAFLSPAGAVCVASAAALITLDARTNNVCNARLSTDVAWTLEPLHSKPRPRGDITNTDPHPSTSTPSHTASTYASQEPRTAATCPLARLLWRRPRLVADRKASRHKRRQAAPTKADDAAMTRPQAAAAMARHACSLSLSLWHAPVHPSLRPCPASERGSGSRLARKTRVPHLARREGASPHGAHNGPNTETRRYHAQLLMRDAHPPNKRLESEVPRSSLTRPSITCCTSARRAALRTIGSRPSASNAFAIPSHPHVSEVCLRRRRRRLRNVRAYCVKRMCTQVGHGTPGSFIPLVACTRNSANCL